MATLEKAENHKREEGKDSKDLLVQIRAVEDLIYLGRSRKDEKKEAIYIRALDILDGVIEVQSEEIEIFRLGSAHLIPYVKKVEILEEMGRYEEALDCFERLNLEEIGDMTLCLTKARLTGRIGDVDDALEQFDEIIKKCPIFSDAYLEKADFCFEIGESEKAMECYKNWEIVEAGKND
jgi:tetratricopeptide (TPR) repeat protein